MKQRQRETQRERERERVRLDQVFDDPAWHVLKEELVIAVSGIQQKYMKVRSSQFPVWYFWSYLVVFGPSATPSLPVHTEMIYPTYFLQIRFSYQSSCSIRSVNLQTAPYSEVHNREASTTLTAMLSVPSCNSQQGSIISHTGKAIKNLQMQDQIPP